MLMMLVQYRWEGLHGVSITGASSCRCGWDQTENWCRRPSSHSDAAWRQFSRLCTQLRRQFQDKYSLHSRTHTVTYRCLTAEGQRCSNYIVPCALFVIRQNFIPPPLSQIISLKWWILNNVERFSVKCCDIRDENVPRWFVFCMHCMRFGICTPLIFQPT